MDKDKLKTVPSDLNKLSNVVDNDVVKKTVYDKLVINVSATDTKKPSSSGLVTKRWYDSDKQILENKIECVDKKIPEYNTKNETKRLQRLKTRYLVLLD